MKIDHIAIWVKDLDKMAAFYEHYFQGTLGGTYINSQKRFTSRFVSFSKGCRIELMHNPNIPENANKNVDQHFGIVHFAISVGNIENVDQLTKILEKDGYKVVGFPRTTGDGYYESAILDPEGNRIEITV